LHFEDKKNKDLQNENREIKELDNDLVTIEDEDQ
jgi:hypothetical protein